MSRFFLQDKATGEYFRDGNCASSWILDIEKAKVWKSFKWAENCGVDIKAVGDENKITIANLSQPPIIHDRPMTTGFDLDDGRFYIANSVLDYFRCDLQIVEYDFNGNLLNTVVL